MIAVVVVVVVVVAVAVVECCCFLIIIIVGTPRPRSPHLSLRRIFQNLFFEVIRSELNGTFLLSLLVYFDDCVFFTFDFKTQR